jgi:hypothetical protein
MEVVRIFDLRQFDRTVRRFRDLVYKNSKRKPDDPPTPDGRGGFSVFEAACACPGDGLESSCFCDHIAKFYATIGPEPCVYWAFDIKLFDPPNPNPQKLQAAVLLEVPSDTGDVCHRNMHHVGDGRLDRIRKHQKEEDLRICVNGKSEPFTIARATELYDLTYNESGGQGT